MTNNLNIYNDSKLKTTMKFNQNTIYG